MPAPLIVVGADYATFIWVTDEPSTTRVESSNAEGPFNYSSDELVTYHEVTMPTVPVPETYYHSGAYSVDAEGNESYWHTHVWTPASGTTVPSITTPPQAVDVTPTSARITFTTDLPAVAMIRYGTAAGSPDMVAVDVAATTHHSIVLPISDPGQTYYLEFYIATDFGGQIHTFAETAVSLELPGTSLPGFVTVLELIAIRNNGGDVRREVATLLLSRAAQASSASESASAALAIAARVPTVESKTLVRTHRTARHWRDRLAPASVDSVLSVNRSRLRGVERQESRFFE